MKNQVKFSIIQMIIFQYNHIFLMKNALPVLPLKSGHEIILYNGELLAKLK